MGLVATLCLVWQQTMNSVSYSTVLLPDVCSLCRKSVSKCVLQDYKKLGTIKQTGLGNINAVVIRQRTLNNASTSSPYSGKHINLLSHQTFFRPRKQSPIKPPIDLRKQSTSIRSEQYTTTPLYFFSCFTCYNMLQHFLKQIPVNSLLLFITEGATDVQIICL